jgi:cytochrome P450
MTVTQDDVHFDMFDRTTYASPYETFRRLRNEAPLYVNEERGFYAVSRADDVGRVLGDRDTFISSKGAVYGVAKAGIQMPPGLFIFEDPPLHTMHRSIVSRLFTPRAVNGLEDEIRKLCVELAEPLVGRDRFDFMLDYAMGLPVQVIGMLVGVPKADQASLLAVFQEGMHREPVEGGGTEDDHFQGIVAAAAWFNDYLDWRERNPSDDVMTQLLEHEFVDDTGTRRKLRRDETVTYLTLITSAGSDTTATSIGWAGKLLSDHPDQRRELVEDPSLIPGAVEEVLRCEPPTYTYCRVLARDAEFHGQTVPAGSIMVVLPSSANRDESRWEDSERFDVHRTPQQIYSFGFGPHFCLGANLARLEARIALEELLPRVPEWTVDMSGARLTPGIDTRAYERLPVEV